MDGHVMYCVKTDPTYGKGLYATEDIEPDRDVLKEAPLVFALAIGSSNCFSCLSQSWYARAQHKYNLTYDVPPPPPPPPPPCRQLSEEVFSMWERHVLRQRMPGLFVGGADVV